MSEANNIQAVDLPESDEGVSFLDLLIVIVKNRWLLLFGPLAAAILALVVAFYIPPVYTATAVIMPPQNQQNIGAAMLQSFGGLAGLAGAAAGIRNPADQYVALMQSNTISDRIIAKFELKKVYRKEMLQDARSLLKANTSIVAGKKDGLLVVQVDDTDPKRAAHIANEYVEQLRRLTSELAVTEAQQRRVFFEKQLQVTRARLTEAQKILQSSGFNQGDIRAEPRAVAEAYAALKAQVTAAEVRLQGMRAYMTEDAPEFKQMLQTLYALRRELNKAEVNDMSASGSDYVANYRQFKYQETLFELFSKQYELAKLDESRDGALIQVVDSATPPERKSKPRKATLVATAGALTVILLLVFVIVRQIWQATLANNLNERKLTKLRNAWR